MDESSNLSRPNARSIYCKSVFGDVDLRLFSEACSLLTVQRKEYASSVHQIMNNTQYRVEVRSAAPTSNLTFGSAQADPSRCSAAAPLHVRAGRAAAEDRVGLRGAAAAAGGDGPRVGPEHVAGGAGPQTHAHRHRNQGDRHTGWAPKPDNRLAKSLERVLPTLQLVLVRFSSV